MLALVVGGLLSVAVAAVLLLRCDPGTPTDRLLGESLVLAPALPAATLFLLDLFSIPWSRGALFGVGVVTLGLLVSVRPRRAGVPGSSGRALSKLDITIAILVGMTVVLLWGGYSRFALVTAGAENDFIGIWGAKARTFFEAGGIDWEFLASPWRGYAHPDYPLLVPLIFSSVAVAAGGWVESQLGLVYSILGAGGLILALSEFRRRSTSVALQAIGVLAVTPFILSPWIGLADGPLALLAMAALLRFARWLEEPERGHLTVGAVFLGFAMSTKNEGLALGIVTVVAVVVLTPRERRSSVALLWPAGLIAGPWLLLRAVHGLSTDLFEGAAGARLFGRLFDPGYLAALGGYLVEYRPGRSLTYVAFAAVIALGWTRLGRGGRMVAAVALVQILIDLVAYLVTPMPLEWHVRWSWERLVSQVGAAVAVVAVSRLLELAGRRSGDFGFAGLVGSGPEVENEQPDPDADR